MVTTVNLPDGLHERLKQLADQEHRSMNATIVVAVESIVLGETPQVRDVGLLSSAVVRPATVAFGQEAYTDLWSKAAALLHSVCMNCMNHALIDGNKRLDWVAARVLLALNEVPIQEVDVDQAEALVRSVASGALTEVPDIARELRKLNL